MSEASRSYSNQSTRSVIVNLHSYIDRPIVELPLLEKSLLFAELSNIAYLREDAAVSAAAAAGFAESRFLNRDGSQAFIFENGNDCVVACRGTEPNDWNDIKADVDAVSAVAETVGRVHRGFKTEVDDLWPGLEEALVSNIRTLWFTGHSLGGAMATICAGRCYLSHIKSMPEALFTFGAPRVGNQRYINHVKINWYRWVNNNDIVPRVPPAWMGYKHSGQEIYLNAYGKARSINGWQRTKDLWRGFLGGLKKGRIDNFSDHLIDDYLAHIHTAIRNRGKDPKMPQLLVMDEISQSDPESPQA